ncbi:MAG: replication-associated recombination protein A [Proteobacteria bacterium]|nr:replication-associated recombination protein A [Pseudomonadota bacterium]
MAGDDSLELFPKAAPRPETAQAVEGADPLAPLADRMRPRSLDEVVGQDALLGPGGALRTLIEAGELPSLILWGPPGSGKTTLARLMAGIREIRFEGLSAVLAGVKEIRAVAERAAYEKRAGVRTLLFLDELHRLNRAQQDVLLPHVESGTVTLVGATTENPSFEVNAPLLSRCRVFTLSRLDEDALAAVVERAAADESRGLGGVALAPEALRAIADAADGDARRALNVLESAATIHRCGPDPESPISPESVREAAGRRVFVHDRDRDEHYNVASAFIKSLRASDPDAALYYLARLLDTGDDPLFAARRMVIFASEDVGNADPSALPLATSAFLAVERIGMPEGRIPLAQAATYLACAPKSNASYAALGRASQTLEETGSLPVPLHLRNAPTPLMKSEGYGRDYRYPHDKDDQFVPDANLPDKIRERRFYEPKDVGAETEIAERLAAWRRRRQDGGKKSDS